jgi:predicted ArsR family transcriptional regulator
VNTLLILYLIYLSWGTAGQGRVSFLELSRYLRKSKSGVRLDMANLSDEGLVEVVMTFTFGGGNKYYVSLSDKGQDFLMANFDAARDAYHQHVAETILVIKARAKDGMYEPRKLSKKEVRAIEAGQIGMFGDEND